MKKAIKANKMKLVLVYDIESDESDEYENYNSVVIPFEYDSIEAADKDFKKLVNKNKRKYSFKFCGHEAFSHYFFKRKTHINKKGMAVKNKNLTYEGPMFFTLDEWFLTFKNS